MNVNKHRGGNKEMDVFSIIGRKIRYQVEWKAKKSMPSGVH